MLHSIVNQLERRSRVLYVGVLSMVQKNVKRQGKDCFICNKSGHRAKDCTKKFKKCSQGSELCLKCGSSGHAMASCNNDYSLDDLKEIQCYVGNSFGHLCCANYFGTDPSEVERWKGCFIQHHPQQHWCCC